MTLISGAFFSLKIMDHPAIEGVPMEFQLKPSLAPAPEIWVEVHFVSLPKQEMPWDILKR